MDVVDEASTRAWRAHTGTMVAELLRRVELLERQRDESAAAMAETLAEAEVMRAEYHRWKHTMSERTAWLEAVAEGQSALWAMQVKGLRGVAQEMLRAVRAAD